MLDGGSDRAQFHVPGRKVQGVHRRKRGARPHKALSEPGTTQSRGHLRKCNPYSGSCAQASLLDWSQVVADRVSVMCEEHVLAGGNTGGAVVRVGATVRKTWTVATPSVLNFMAAVRSAGVDVPAVLDRDEQGRQVTEFIPGRLAIDSKPLTRTELHRVGALIRSIHDASEHYVPPSGAEWNTAIPTPGEHLVCHNDMDQIPEEAGRNLAALVSGYDADDTLRTALPAEMYRRTNAMYQLLSSSHDSGVEPWASMFNEGHGDHWRAVRDYTAEHCDVWARALTPTGA